MPAGIVETVRDQVLHAQLAHAERPRAWCVPRKDSAQRSTLGRRSKAATGGFSTISTYSLFLAVLLGVSLHCLFGVPSGVNNMSPRCVSMVRRLLMTSGLVMFGRHCGCTSHT